MKIRLIDFTHSPLAHARSRVLLVCLISILFLCSKNKYAISTMIARAIKSVALIMETRRADPQVQLSINLH